MRLLFVYHLVEDRGSAGDIDHYARAAADLGHEVALYGRGAAGSRLPYSLDLAAAEAVVFVFEWTTRLQRGDRLDLARLAARVPRRRRLVIDCDGKYNDVIAVTGDANHPDAAAARHWIETCDALADKVCQPTLHPLRPNVRPFLFHAYSPEDEVPLGTTPRDYGLIYVGNNWFRWRSLARLLHALEPVRHRLGRMALVGHGWGEPAPWAGPGVPEDACHTEPDWLRALGLELLPPVAFTEVLGWMSKGACSPVIYRPLFERLRLVTCRTFETPAADTVPLFDQDEEFVSEIHGPAAAELRLGAGRPEEKVLDVLRRPAHYAAVVRAVRQHLAARHSYRARLRELVELLQQ
jgi:hypothetical protein